MRVFMVGGGKRAYFLARSLVAKGHTLTILDTNADECRLFARRLKATVICGDGTVPRILRDADAAGADLLLALTPNDEDNLIACQIAVSAEFHVRSVFAVVNDPDNEAVFHALGINATFSLTQMIGSLIEQRAHVGAITNLAPVVEGRLSLTELMIEPGAPSVGRPLRDLQLPVGSLVVSILRGGIASVPDGAAVLQTGDIIAFVADPNSYPKTLKALTGSV